MSKFLKESTLNDAGVLLIENALSELENIPLALDNLGLGSLNSTLYNYETRITDLEGSSTNLQPIIDDITELQTETSNFKKDGSRQMTSNLSFDGGVKYIKSLEKNLIGLSYIDGGVSIGNLTNGLVRSIAGKLTNSQLSVNDIDPNSVTDSKLFESYFKSNGTRQMTGDISFNQTNREIENFTSLILRSTGNNQVIITISTVSLLSDNRIAINKTDGLNLFNLPNTQPGNNQIMVSDNVKNLSWIDIPDVSSKLSKNGDAGDIKIGSINGNLELIQNNTTFFTKNNTNLTINTPFVLNGYSLPLNTGTSGHILRLNGTAIEFTPEQTLTGQSVNPVANTLVQRTATSKIKATEILGFTDLNLRTDFGDIYSTINLNETEAKMYCRGESASISLLNLGDPKFGQYEGQIIMKTINNAGFNQGSIIIEDVGDIKLYSNSNVKIGPISGANNYTLPNTQGNIGEVLKMTGNGVAGWGGISNPDYNPQYYEFKKSSFAPFPSTNLYSQIPIFSGTTVLENFTSSLTKTFDTIVNNSQLTKNLNVYLKFSMTSDQNGTQYRVNIAKNGIEFVGVDFTAAIGSPAIDVVVSGDITCAAGDLISFNIKLIAWIISPVANYTTTTLEMQIKENVILPKLKIGNTITESYGLPSYDSNTPDGAKLIYHAMHKHAHWEVPSHAWFEKTSTNSIGSTTIVSVQNTWYPVIWGPTNNIGENFSFTGGDAGLTFSLANQVNVNFHIGCSFSLNASNSNNNLSWEMGVSVNGVLVTGSIVNVYTTDSGFSLSTAIHKILSLNTGDTVGLLVRTTSNIVNGNNPVIKYINMFGMTFASMH